MFIRAVIAFLALPVMVLGIIPILIIIYAPTHFDGFWWGRFPFAAGCAALFTCVIAFYSEGKGTLAHWDPPKKLITSGFYKYTRNPMYVGVIFILIGESLISGSLWLLAWLVVLAIVFVLHVRRVEEPWLERTFGDDWIRYLVTVPRWWPRRPE